jgi:hypothetical protein
MSMKVRTAIITIGVILIAAIVVSILTGCETPRSELDVYIHLHKTRYSP